MHPALHPVGGLLHRAPRLFLDGHGRTAAFIRLAATDFARFIPAQLPFVLKIRKDWQPEPVHPRADILYQHSRRPGAAVHCYFDQPNLLFWLRMDAQPVEGQPRHPLVKAVQSAFYYSRLVGSFSCVKRLVQSE